MQSADPRKLDDATYRARLDGTRLRAVVGEALVRPIRVVVAEKFMERPSQVGLVPDDHVVETVATSRPDPALAVWILPRRAVGREHFLDSEIADALSQERAVNAVAPLRVSLARDFPGSSRSASVSDEKPGGRVEWKGLDHLLRSPLRRRARGDVEVHDAPALVRNDDEHVQNAD